MQPSTTFSCEGALCSLASLLSFFSNTLKSTYWSCLLVLWSESLSLTMSCGNECILGYTEYGFASVSNRVLVVYGEDLV